MYVLDITTVIESLSHCTCCGPEKRLLAVSLSAATAACSYPSLTTADQEPCALAYIVVECSVRLCML